MTDQLVSPDTSIAGASVNGVDHIVSKDTDDEKSLKREKSSDETEVERRKRVKIPTPDMTKNGADDEISTPESLSTKVKSTESSPDEKATEKDDKKTLKMRQREQAKLEKERKREMERLEREKKKEEERRRKEDERIKREQKKEEERLQREAEKERREEEKRQRQAEKEQEKEMKRKKLEEERLERERKKEEEKERKKAEREEKEKQRLERKKKLEEEKLKKEEMQRKEEEMKQRSQMKISSFFSVGNTENSVAKKDNAAKDRNNNNPSNQHPKTAYEQIFLPFFVKRNVKMASNSSLSASDLSDSKASIDEALKTGSSSKPDLHSLFKNHSNHLPNLKYTTPKSIINALNSSEISESEVYGLISNLAPIKYLHFYEISRPPYVGTWCSSKHQETRFPIENPFDVTSTGIDYDYDSDIEWNGEEEGEGEDIDGDDDEEDEDELNDEDEEMEDFVENESETRKKRRLMGPLEPINIWNNGNNNETFKSMRFESLDVNIKISIDPYFDYWKQKPLQSEESDPQNKTNGNDTSSSIASPSSANVKKIIQDDKIITELISFIEKNNSFTIGTLVELAKREFKAYTKVLLKQTIQEVAMYNKKTFNWEIKSDLKGKYKPEVEI